MKCPYCSKDILDGAIWCRFCKNHLDEEAKSVSTSGKKRGSAPGAAPLRPWPGGAGVTPGDGEAIQRQGMHPGPSPGRRPEVGGVDGDFNRGLPTEVDLERSERKRAALAEVRLRMTEVQTLMEKCRYKAAANEAVAAREYIHSLTVDDSDIDSEMESLEQKIALLEEMGYKGSDPDFPHGRPRFVLPRITLGQIILVTLVCLVIWGAYTLHRVTSENALRQPGGIGGTLMIRTGQGDAVLQPLPFQGVSLYQADAEGNALQSRLAALRDARSAWKMLSTRKGFPKATATARTDNVGNFKFEQVPPGEYYVMACSPHEDNPQAWFVAVHVSPLKVTKVTLRVENAVKAAK